MAGEPGLKLRQGYFNLKRGIFTLLFPSRPVCPLCGRENIPGQDLCVVCRETIDLWQEQTGCQLCARPCGTGELICSVCRGRRPPFALVRGTVPYDDVFREAIQKLKFQGERWLGEPLGRLMAARVRQEPLFGSPDLIVPVPLHQSRLRERGFNQSELLAAEISRQLVRPLGRGLLVKTKETKDQVGLTKEARWENLRGVFAVPRPAAVTGAAVLLVDDIFTTGSTVSQACLALTAAGARRVAVITWAYTPR